MDIIIYELKDELGRAHKESQMIRQRLNSFESEFTTARSCVRDLVSKLTINENYQSLLEEDFDRAVSKCRTLERRVRRLEQNNMRLERERDMETMKTVEVREKFAAEEVHWKRTAELASTRASERAERALTDCEWKTRELEKRAKNANRKVTRLKECLEESIEENESNLTRAADVSRLRLLCDEQRRSIDALVTRCISSESREIYLQRDLEGIKHSLDSVRVKAAYMENNAKELESLKAELTLRERQYESRLAELETRSQILQRCHLVAIEEKHNKEIGELLEREKKLELLRREERNKHRLEKKKSQQKIKHLTKKCQGLNKLLGDMKTDAEERGTQGDIQILRSEVSRLTKNHIEYSSDENTR